MDTIKTLHPQGRQGVEVDSNTYYQVSHVILETLAHHPQGLTFTQLLKEASEKLTKQKFTGSPGWYITIIKLDLETRGEIICSREPRSSQLITLKENPTM